MDECNPWLWFIGGALTMWVCSSLTVLAMWMAGLGKAKLV